MNEEQEKNTFEEEFNNLPEGLREALASEDVAEVIEEIGKKFALHLDVMDDLFDEIGLVMIGITPPRYFVSSLQKRLGIPCEQVNAIAREVNEKIFQPLRDSLREMHVGKEGELPTEILDDSVEPVITTQNQTLDKTKEDLKELGIEHVGGTLDLDNGSEIPDNLPIERDDILAAIEDPLPQTSPIKTVSDTPPTPNIPTMVIEKKEVPPAVTVSAPRPAINETKLSDDIFASKLTGTISIPDQKIDMSKGAINTPPSGGYKVDPYREPIS